MKLRHIIYYMGIWALFLFVLFLTSCRTRTVAMDRYVTYDRTDKSVDSTLQRRFVQAFEQMARCQSTQRETSVRETTHVKDSTSTMVDADGKVIRTDNFHTVVSNKDSKETTMLRDSILVLRLTVDSLQEVRIGKDSLLVAQKDSINELRKNVSTLQETSWNAWMVLALLLAYWVVAIMAYAVGKYTGGNNYGKCNKD